MRNHAIIIFLMAATSLQAEEHRAVVAPSGRFEVTQDDPIEKNQNVGESIETIRFRDAKFPAVRLTGYPWPGDYSISPNERWLLRSQKTGAGDSIAMLYQVEKNGRVSEVLGFDDLLWTAADSASRLKHNELYHTAVEAFAWAADSSSLEITVRGSNASKSEDGVQCRIRYDLKSHQATVIQIHCIN